MFDIIIRDGKKESYIKLNGNKLEGFNAINGVVTPLTIEEVNTINLLKLSDNKTYLGNNNGYDVYLDNNSDLKHYFKDEKEDFEATWEYNGKDALLYSENENIDKNKVKKFNLKKTFITITKTVFTSVIGSSIALSLFGYAGPIDGIKYEISKAAIAINSDYSDNVTVEQIKTYINENENLTEEEKDIFSNEKLLQDVIPYYENTNMNILIPLRFENLQMEYFYEEPKTKGAVMLTGAYVNPLEPKKIYVNTFFEEEELRDNKVHEHVHRLQSSMKYAYIGEASAEIISCEYDEKCVNNTYLEAVKNTKILMEIIGPEPIWKLNFSGDDTDLVNVIRANLEEEQAKELIGLLKKEPYSVENLDNDITTLLGELYRNIYGEEMEKNFFIWGIVNINYIKNRYYFNSYLIEQEAPYVEHYVAKLYSAYAVSDNYDSLISTRTILDKESRELFMLSRNEITINSIRDLNESMIKANDIRFFYQGEEIEFNSIDLEKYENVSVSLRNSFCPEISNALRIEKTYYPTIYESFPDQRIGEKNIIK